MCTFKHMISLEVFLHYTRTRKRLWQRRLFLQDTASFGVGEDHSLPKVTCLVGGKPRPSTPTVGEKPGPPGAVHVGLGPEDSWFHLQVSQRSLVLGIATRACEDSVAAWLEYSCRALSFGHLGPGMSPWTGARSSLRGRRKPGGLASSQHQSSPLKTQDNCLQSRCR